MLKRIFNTFFMTLVLFNTAIAASGNLFNVATSGTALAQTVSFTLCLDVAGNTPLSCQNYTTQKATLSIRTTIPNHTYNHAGIKVNTPGYTYTATHGLIKSKQSRGVAPGYAEFVVSNTRAAGGTVSNVSTNTYTVGGTVTGLTGTVTLLNNGMNSTSISTVGSFTFSTAIAEGSTYAVTVSSQPVDQTCTVANGTGTMGGANVTNVTVTCSTNTYTVGGTVTGLTGTVTLLNNGMNSTSISTVGSFTFSTAIAEGSTYAVTVSSQPVDQTCTVANGTGTMGGANVTNVSVSCDTNNTTLSVDATGIIPVYSGAGTPGTITVTNTGTTYAYNVSASLPGGWTGVTQDHTNCASIAPGVTCTLSFHSTKPYVAQNNITVSGDNITSPPSTALAFSMSGYLVFAVPSGSTALVVANDDATGSPVIWSSNSSGSYDAGVPIYGISETSTFLAPNPSTGQVGVQTACNGSTNGLCDTDNIYIYYNGFVKDSPIDLNYYAAGLCYQITSDSSGGSFAEGTWYLPAICQLGTYSNPPGGTNAGCTNTANVETNLYNFGFLSNLSTTVPYWSSTESSGLPQSYAWVQAFYVVGDSSQFNASKQYQAGVRCVRAFTY